jgi:hypothetical protein
VPTPCVTCRVSKSWNEMLYQAVGQVLTAIIYLVAVYASLKKCVGKDILLRSLR